MIRSAFPIITTSHMASLVEFYVETLGGRITYQFSPGATPQFVNIELGDSILGIGRDADISYEGRQRFSLWIYVDSCDETVEGIGIQGLP